MKKKKLALITGSSGQDGSYLTKLLLAKNYIVVAGDRRSSRNNDWRFRELKIHNNKNVIIEDIDLSDLPSLTRLFLKYKFDEVYNLAAQSFVASSFNTPISTSDVTALGVLRMLETIRNHSPKTKFYQASSSEMFGKTSNKLQDEKTQFAPRSPYAVSKVFGHYITKNYRESFGIFACSGILFNHESPLRGNEFVTKKIVQALVNIKFNKQKYLELGNINSVRDWGFAKDYVYAMWLMLQRKKPDDYVIANNTICSVKKFVELTCKELNIKIKWIGKGINLKGLDENKKVIIKINRKYFRPAEVNYLRGNYSKARKLLKWKPEHTLKQMIRVMVDFELNNFSNLK